MATRLGKRPHPKNYATYDPKGKAQYRKDLAEYLKKKAAMEKEKNKLSTKKNIEKQKTSNKKASTAKPKTTAKPKVTPKATATKGKSLATGKTTSKTKAVETVKTPKVTTTKRRAATSTKKKVTPKATVKKPAGKVPAKKPLISNKNKLRIKKAATTARKATVKTAKTVGKKIGEAKKTIATKSTAVKKAFKKKAPKPTTPAQKAVSKVYQGGKKLIKKGVTKGLPKFIEAVKKNPKSALKGGVAGIATAGLTGAINERMDRAFAKRAGMSLQEYQAKKKKVRDSQRIIPTAIRTVKGIAKRVKGKSGESSTQTNINKQKKANTTPNRGLKIRKTERSSRKNTNKDYNAPTATKKADKRFSTFRVDSNENLKLQKERQKGNTETYSRKLSPQAKKQTTTTKTNKNKTKKQSKFIKTASGSLARRGSIAARRAENRERARKRAQEMARRRLANR